MAISQCVVYVWPKFGERQHLQQDKTGQEKVGRLDTSLYTICKANVFNVLIQCKVKICHLQQDRTGWNVEGREANCMVNVQTMYILCIVNV